MASILPNQILPESTPALDQTGKMFAHNWWLFFYNLSQAVLGNSGTTAAAFAAQINADLDADVDSTDELGLVQRVTNLEKIVNDDYPIVYQDGVPWIPPDLPDPVPQAQPVQVIAAGASPFTYTALMDGTVIVNGGTVSAISVSRDGTNFYATSVGSIPVSRLDQIKMTYTGSPTLTFFPR